MKKCYYIILAAAAIVASCAKVDLKEGQKFEPKGGETALFTGTIIQPNGLRTKTTLVGETGTEVSIQWKKGDMIYVETLNDDANPTHYCFYADSDGTEVYFGCDESKISEVATWLNVNDASDCAYTAFYPGGLFDIYEKYLDEIYPTLVGCSEVDTSSLILTCDDNGYNQASLQNMPLNATLIAAEIDNSKGYKGRVLRFCSDYSIFKLTVPAGKGISKMDIKCKYFFTGLEDGGNTSTTITIKDIDKLENSDKGSVVFYAPVVSDFPFSEFIFTAYNNLGEVIATMSSYKDPEPSRTLAKNTIYCFDFCNTLTISSQGTYNLDEIFKNDLDCRINISEDIAGTVAINATKADKIFVNVRNNEVSTLNIDAPNSHVEVENGQATSINAKTSNRTFVAKKDFTVTNLTVEKGSVVVEGGLNGDANVKNIVIPANAEGHISIDVRGVTSSTNEVTINNQKGVGVSVSATESEKGYELAQGSEEVQEIISGDDTFNFVAQIGDANYLTLADAIVDVRPGETIKLIKNVDNATGISVPSGKNFTVDFGNHTYTVNKPGAGSTNTKTIAFQLLKGSTIVFKNGKIQCAQENADLTWGKNDAEKGIAMMIQNYADLTLDNMTIDATYIAQKGTEATEQIRYAVSTNNGSTTFKDSTCIITVGNDIAFDSCDNPASEISYPGKPTVTWNSTGSVTGGIELSGGDFVVKSNLKVATPIRANSGASTMTVNAGVVVSPVDEGFGKAVKTKYANTSDETQKGVVVVNRGGDLTINGNGKIAATTNYAAVSLTEKGEDDATNAAKLTVDENVTLEGYYYGIVGNGTRHNTEITVNGGTIKGTNTTDGNQGIFHPQDGILTINGGNILGYDSAVEVRAGTVNIFGGSLTSTATSFKCKSSKSGSTTVGAALAIAQHTTRKAISVTIDGGTFTGYKAISVEDPENGEPQNVNVTINGGTFSDEGALKYAAKNANITIQLQKDRTAGTGVFVKADQNQIITFDLNGHNFVGVAPAVGSHGTENQLFHIEKNNNFTLKNSVPSTGGTVSIDENNASEFRFIIMDYATLSLENVTLDGTNLGHSNTPYTLSVNYQDVSLSGNTSIIAKEGNVAFDVYEYKNNTSYPTAPTVTVETTGNIIGCVEVTGGKLIVNKGNFKSTSTTKEKAPAIRVDSGEIVVNDGTFESTKNSAVKVYGGSAEFNGGTFTGLEGAVNFPGSGATIVIDGGTYTATDNAVLAGLGTDDGRAANTVTVKAGTFNGKIASEGYIACGIYAPWKDVITVTGGTFNITKGCGVVVRGGSLTMSGAEFKYDGETTMGWVGDRRYDLPCTKDVVVDYKANYPDKDNISVTASGYSIESIN